MGTVLQRFGLRNRRKQKGIKKAQHRTFFCEPLEKRELLSVCTWNGQGTDNKWSTAANWGGTAPVAGDQLVFAGTTRTASQDDLAAGTSFQSIEFQNSGFSLSGNGLTVANHITVDSGATNETISLGVALSGTINVNVADNTSLTLSGVLSDATGGGSLVMNDTGSAGTGKMVLSGTNTYTGGMTVNGGTLNAPTPGAVPNYGTSGNLSVANGGVFTVTVGSAAGSWTSSNVSSLLANTSAWASGSNIGFYVSNNATFVCSNPITNSGIGLVLSGAIGSTLELTGNNTFTGPTTITTNNTYLQIGDGSTGEGFASASVTTTGSNLSGLVFNLSDTLTYGGIISGTQDGVKVKGGGTVILTGANTNSGAATLYAGSTLEIGNGGTGELINYAITGSGTAIFNMADTLTDAKSILSTIAVHKQGSGTLILTSTASTYTGGTTISNGTLEANVPAALPGYGTSGKLSVASGATVAVAVGGTGQWSATNINTLLGNTSAFASGSILGFDTTGGNFSYSTVIGAGALSTIGVSKLGSNTLTLTGTNTYAGGTTINGGTLQLGNVSALGSGSVTLSAGTLDLDGYSPSLGALSGSAGSTVTTSVAGPAALTTNTSTGNSTFAGVITNGSGTVSLTKTGSGTLALSGANTYTGSTTISGGTLSIGNGGSGESLASSVVDNATLTFNHADSLTYSGLISGSGQLDQTAPVHLLFPTPIPIPAARPSAAARCNWATSPPWEAAA